MRLEGDAVAQSVRLSPEPMSGWEESGRYCTGRGPRWGLKEDKIGEDSEMGRREQNMSSGQDMRRQ